MLVVGEKDAQNGTVTLRDRIDGDLGALSLDRALAKLRQEVDEKTVRQVADTSGPALVDRGDKIEY
jgi:threonyl-tRNA synthetase